MAETNINIYLQVADTGDPTNPQDPGTTPQPEDPTQNKGEKGKEGKTMTQMVGAYIGKQALDMATSRVGQATHSSLMQQKMNSVLKIGVYGGLIAANPILGGLALATDLISSSIDYTYNSKQDARGVAILTGRAGNINRSR